MDGGNRICFNSSEFVNYVFERRTGTKKYKQNDFHSLRMLNKFHSTQFDEYITSARVHVSNLQSFASSKFALQVRFLNVQIPNNMENLNSLRNISATVLRNIEKVDVNFIEGKYANKKMVVFQPLILRGVNIIHDFDEHKSIKKLIRIFSFVKDFEIIDSSFEGIGLWLDQAKKVSIKSTVFKNIPRDTGLYIWPSFSTITIDNVRFLNCYTGLITGTDTKKVSINKIYVEKCKDIGCVFRDVEELNLNGAEIVDCKLGIEFSSANAKMQNCRIVNAGYRSIRLVNSRVRHHQIYIKKFDRIDVNFETIAFENSIFTEIR
eukprot:TRINITY_DN6169_c0_g1_i1.p1 TRINITY_DN6169_c0_g1~~TRINITY_DN6169_c0_g1_i1.p1  ORF type:complete len:339 (-),score=22.70 TRINITY_DN6169_c0_g1_i1:84-1043(-)